MQTRKYEVLACILAAGKAKRMGKDKLALEAKNGMSILRQVIDNTLQSEVENCVIFSAVQHHNILPAGFEYQTIKSDDFSYTVKTAIEYANRQGATHVQIILGDMPDVTSHDIDLLIAASLKSPDAFVIAAHKGRAGNPVILPLDNMATWIADISGDRGARAVFASGHRPVLQVECGPGVLLDIDTPEDYANYLRT